MNLLKQELSLLTCIIAIMQIRRGDLKIVSRWGVLFASWGCCDSLQARKSKRINVPTSLLWVERNIVVPTTNRYSLTGNPAIKFTQAKNFSNSPSGTTFWAAGVAGDRLGRYVLARSVTDGSESRN